jgi:hypothetical protein
MPDRIGRLSIFISNLGGAIMRKTCLVFACLSIVLGLTAATAARAQTNVHSFVSAAGTGTACTFSAPCGTFETALAATISDGLISCVDQGANSAGSNVTRIQITQSVTIDCAGTSAASWYITINGSGIVLTLRHLVVTGAVQNYGIDFQNGAALFVGHCLIEHFPSAGIHFAPTSGTAKLQVTDSVITNNGPGGGDAGVLIVPAVGGAARVVVDRTVVDNNAVGISANGSSGMVLVEIKDSTVANNTGDGIWAQTTLFTSSVVLTHSSSNHNSSGANAQGANAWVSLNDTTVAWNANGLLASSGGTIISYKKNLIGGNPNPA